MKSQDLLPCPFCKSHLVPIECEGWLRHPGSNSPGVRDRDCPLEGELFDPQRLATWNRRSSGSTPQQALTVQQDVLDEDRRLSDKLWHQYKQEHLGQYYEDALAELFDLGRADLARWIAEQVQGAPEEEP